MQLNLDNHLYICNNNTLSMLACWSILWKTSTLFHADYFYMNMYKQEKKGGTKELN